MSYKKNSTCILCLQNETLAVQGCWEECSYIHCHSLIYWSSLFDRLA